MTGEIPLLIVLLILFIAALVRSTFGFGDAIVGMPLLALIVPMKIATPLMGFMGPTLALPLLVREWRHLHPRSAIRLILATLAGIPVGLFYLRDANERVVTAVLAAVIILFSLYSLFRPGLLRLRSDRAALPFGFAAGILGAAYNANGPPVVFYGALRGWKPERFRATLQGYFLPTGAAVAVSQGIAGFWTKPVFWTYVYSLPLVVLAIFIGSKFRRKIPEQKFNRVIYGLLLVVGAGLLIKAIG